LVLEEERTPDVRRLVREDPAIATWWGTLVEATSAIARRERDGALDGAGVVTALRDLDDLAAGWVEVEPAADLRRTASRLLRVHPLRAADVLQLAAALMSAAGRPEELPFVTFDDRLADAASREGFPIVRPGG
jgi:predicted nucleic acid-binding protein